MSTNAKGFPTTSSLRPAALKGSKPEIEKNLADVFIVAIDQMFSQYGAEQLTELKQADFKAQDLLKWESKIHSLVSQTAQNIAESTKNYKALCKEMKLKSVKELKELAAKYKLLYSDRTTAEREIAHFMFLEQNKKITV